MPIARLISMEEMPILFLENPYSVRFKYVRVGDEYRFVDANGFYVSNHDQMIDKDEKPISAGFVTIFRNGDVVTNGHSMSLKLCPAKDDESNLTELFNRIQDGNNQKTGS